MSEIHRAYSKGYATAQRRGWPKHRPPHPPQAEVAAIMKAAQELRDAADGICATLMEDDDFVKELGPKVDAVDAAMRAVTEWLNEKLSHDA